MPRSRGRFGGKSSYKPARNPPQRAAPAPPPAPAPPKSESPSGGLGSALVDGFGWGIGVSVARRIVDSFFGRDEIVSSSAASALSSAQSTTTNNNNINNLGSDVCAGQTKAFQECVNSFGSEISKCQLYMDMLFECRRSSDSPQMA